MKNRYDNLQAQAKRYRNKIERHNTRTNNKVNALKSKILQLQYKNKVYCNMYNNKVIDLTSLIYNEQQRIIRDAKENRLEEL